jgi:Cu(I)/Ag(I) efflux system membrane protein CusA/SilA
VPAFLRLGSEFMPPLHEGAFLYMPTRCPACRSQSARILQIQDRILK